MFTHVLVGTNDLTAAKKFYDSALCALGLPKSADVRGRLYYPSPHGAFIVGAPRDGEATYANGGTIGFKAETQAAVDEFHAGGLANGGVCEGPPGPREFDGVKLYGAYLRDPDGNKICAFYSPPN